MLDAFPINEPQIAVVAPIKHIIKVIVTGCIALYS